jgi:hypothetical protein
MRRLIWTAAMLVAMSLALAPAASADGGTDLPLAPVSSAVARPPGFTTNALQAMAAAKATPTMQALHAREHPLFVQPWIWGGRWWYVSFAYKNRLVAEVDISGSGRVLAVWTGAQAGAVYTHGHYAPLFASWWLVVPFSVAFLLPFLGRRRIFTLASLDALALLSFLASFYVFYNANLELSVWLAYPPLVYLLARMLAIGMRPGSRAPFRIPVLGSRSLTIGLLVLVAARVALSLVNHTVIDVGYASVIGAHRIAHGQSLYYASAAHADTYGPVAYLAYVPFELLFPWHGKWDYLPAAHVAAIAFDLVTILALIALGRRLRPGRQGRRLGLILGWAWAACPFTLLPLMMHSNDGLIAMLVVLSLLWFSSPSARGGLLGLAAAAKFSPAALLPLFAGERSGGERGRRLCLAAFLIVVVCSIGPFLPSGGVAAFYHHTIGFQLSRSDVFSIWALHPALDPLKVALAVATVALALLVAFIPRRRSLAQTCALAAAVTIAVQLLATHWFYYYIVWFVPFVLVTLLIRLEPASVLGDTFDATVERQVPAVERPAVPVLESV